MKNLLLVFVGGGFGSVLRFVMGKYLNSPANGFPYGTFAANMIGSLLIGIILGLAVKNQSISQSQTLLLATGFCGGFTTFATFAYENHVFLNTGSPHHVQFEEQIENFDIKTKGAKIRYGSPYNEAGSNVNFVKKISDQIFAVRTYERGVEDETLSCGTGVTAVALAMHALKETNENLITLKVQGGELQVSFDVENGVYKNVWLIGPATYVFSGTL